MEQSVPEKGGDSIQDGIMSQKDVIWMIFLTDKLMPAGLSKLLL